MAARPAEHCARCGTDSDLRRLEITYITRVKISESVLCASCLRSLVVIDTGVLERLQDLGETTFK